MLEKIKEIQTELLEELYEHLEDGCVHELGEVTDMIKDLEEVVYYYTIVEAMNK